MRGRILSAAFMIALSVSGCTTSGVSLKQDADQKKASSSGSSGGTSTRQAVALARDYMLQSQFADEVDTARGKILGGDAVECLTNHWLVTFPDKSSFWKDRYYYVIVKRGSGQVLAGGVNWKQGDHIAALLKGADTCQ